jgi:phage repressor protein C with HTH and peptisase S24 domain
MKVGKTINERLTKVREALGHNPQAFADLLGVSRPYITNIEKGRNKVPMEIASFLIETLNVAPDYIMSGKGSMFLTKTEEAPKPTETANLSANLSANPTPKEKTKRTKNELATTASNLRVLVTTVDASGNDNIALVGTRVAAGYAQGGFIEPEFMQSLPTFSLPDSAYRNGSFRAFQVSGDSMQPTLYEGDWVICRYIDNWAQGINDTFVYVVVTTDRPVVKRVLNRLNERGQLTLQSDNVAYPAQFLDGEEVREVWVAVGRLSRQFANPRYDLVQEMSRTRADVDELLARLTALEQNKAVSTL